MGTNGKLMDLAQTDFAQEPVFMACDDSAVSVMMARIGHGGDADGQIPREEFLRSSEPTFVDPTGAINLLAGWDKGDLELVGTIVPTDQRLELTYSSDTTLVRLL
jgi:hypothetical protein